MTPRKQLLSYPPNICVESSHHREEVSVSLCPVKKYFLWSGVFADRFDFSEKKSFPFTITCTNAADQFGVVIAIDSEILNDTSNETHLPNPIVPEKVYFGLQVKNTLFEFCGEFTHVVDVSSHRIQFFIDLGDSQKEESR